MQYSVKRHFISRKIDRPFSEILDNYRPLHNLYINHVIFGLNQQYGQFGLSSLEPSPVHVIWNPKSLKCDFKNMQNKNLTKEMSNKPTKLQYGLILKTEL